MNIGRYQVLEEIGRGSMGVVYKAHDPNLDLTVALKVLRQDRLVSSAFVKRFLAEAKALGRLDHPNIIRVFNVDQDEESVYIAMEFIEGEPLDELMQRKRLTTEEIIDLGVTVADALDYAHQKGIIHRDIKPSNILVKNDGRLKITDFGIAHIEDTAASIQTQAGEILGTPAYMSPEQVMSRQVDGRSDIFSLGIILYELSTGTRPFKGDTMMAVLNAITQNEPPLIKSINPDLPHKVSGIILRCLNKTPDKRFKSSRVLAEELKKVLAEIKAGSAAGKSKPKMSMGRIIALSTVVLAILVGLVVYFHSSSQKSDNLHAGEETGKGVLNVDSAPEKAQVFVDGDSMGNTPLRIELQSGEHEVRLMLTDYHTWEAKLELPQYSETPLFVRLLKSGEEDKGM